MLIGALGCNLAWAIIDAVMFLMGTKGERALSVRTVHAVAAAEDPAVAREIVADALPPILLPALSAADLERLRLHLITMSRAVPNPRLSPRDYLDAAAVFLLVFLCTFPVALPFLILHEPSFALRLSNGIAIAMLFLTGYAFGRHSGHPWRVGLLMVAIGLCLVAVALALGG